MAKADVVYASDMDCENEKEDTIEKEIIDPFCNLFMQTNKWILTEETILPTELIVDFTSTNYSNPIYSPPEVRS